MTKTVKIDPINIETSIKTNDNLLSALLKEDLNVLLECEARGMCSTCHVFVKEGMENLSPLNRREKRTLEVITTWKHGVSRLACQARVIGNGVKVEIPEGMYLNAIEDIEDLIGRRAQQDILHPITGKILVEKDKLITRSMITQLNDTTFEIQNYLDISKKAVGDS